MTRSFSCCEEVPGDGALRGDDEVRSTKLGEAGFLANMAFKEVLTLKGAGAVGVFILIREWMEW